MTETNTEGINEILLRNALKGLKAIHEEMQLKNELLKDMINSLREIQSASMITATNTIRILDLLESKAGRKGAV